jgi:hypothetical protein
MTQCHFRTGVEVDTLWHCILIVGPGRIPFA